MDGQDKIEVLECVQVGDKHSVERLRPQARGEKLTGGE